MNDWHSLNSTRHRLVDDVIDEWRSLISDPSCGEEVYHAFLAAHAGLFWGDEACPVVVSRLQLGNDYATDLVVVHDEESYGFSYELIELESPHDPVFTKGGTQTRTLTRALQQVEDWKRWIAANTSTAKRLFPSKAYHEWGNHQLHYSIVIGRRSAVEDRNDKRMQKVTQYECNIRSYDYLTYLLRRRRFFNELMVLEHDFLSPEEINELLNPFFVALGHAEWKAIVSSRSLRLAHMAGYNARAILKHRRVNGQLERRFREAP